MDVEPAPITRSSQRGALAWAMRATIVLTVIAAGIVGLERLLLTYPARLAPLVEGFPLESVEALARVRGAVAYFGDSVVQTAALGDRDPRLLPDMLEDEIREPVARVSQAATGAEVHAAWLDDLAHRASAPRAVVVPVNPRSFSPHWERNPGWVFTDLAARIRHPLLGRLASVLEWDWGRPTDAEFAASHVVVGGEVVGTIAELDQGVGGDPARLTHDRYLVRYAADYGASRRIGALRDLVETANAQAFPVVFYLTPVDVEAMREVLSPEEMAAAERNLELLRAELARATGPVLDASTIVPHADFDHPSEDPHEHLRAPGRLAVTRLVAAALRDVLGVAAADAPDAGSPTAPDAGAAAAAAAEDAGAGAPEGEGRIDGDGTIERAGEAGAFDDTGARTGLEAAAGREGGAGTESDLAPGGGR